MQDDEVEDDETDEARAAAANVARGVELYSPAAIATHTLLFSPLIGGYLAAQNWRRLGEETRAKQTIGLAVGAVVTIVALGYFFPDLPSGAFAGGSAALAMGWHREHKSFYVAHIDGGGGSASWWQASLTGAALTGLLLFAIFSGLDDSRFEAGVAAFEDGHYEVAEREFRAVLEDDGERADARYNLALALVRQGEIAQARRELARIRNSSELAAEARAMREELSVLE